MFKKSLKGVIAFFFVFGSLFLYSCTVGLGESIDTEVPTVQIQYPPASAVVRDWFYIAGNSSDDKGVDEVSVYVYSSTGEKIDVGKTSVEKNGTWKIKVDVQDSDGNDVLKDGTYVFYAVAKDSSGQSSAVNNRTIEIDNTPPVFVIKNPGTTNLENPSKFGSILKITGSVADLHDISELSLSIYTDSSLTGEPKAVLTETDVDKTDGISVTLARYNPDVENKGAASDSLHENYLKIYDESLSGYQEFYASLSLKDSAGVYQSATYKNGSYAQDADSIGNSSNNGLFLNDDVYETFLGKNSTYSLSVADFMRLLNGTYGSTSTVSDGSVTSSVRSESTDEVVLKSVTSSAFYDTETQNTIIKILNEKIKDTAKTPLAFKLNKQSNPTYSVMGYAFSAISNDEANLANLSNYSAAKEGTLTFQAQAGLDGTYVEPKTIKVYLFGPYDTDKLTSSILKTIYDDPEIYYTKQINTAKETCDENATQTVLEQTANAYNLFTASETESSCESFTQTITLPSVIKKGKYYILAASGKDQDGLSLLSSNYYGFTGESSGTPPTVLITGFSDGVMENALSKITLSGTLTSGESELSEKINNFSCVTYTIEINDEVNSKLVGTLKGEATFAFNSGTKKSGTWKIEDLSSATATYENGYSSYECKDGNRYKYKITVTGKDATGGLTSTDTRSFVIDKVLPQIKINDVTPVVKTETSSEETTETTKYTVNGTIKFSCVVTDTNLSNVVVTVKDSDGNSETLYNGSTSTIEKTVDTTNFKDEGFLTFTVTAKDTAGNEVTSSTSNVYVSQKTDNPVVSFTNGNQKSFGIDSNNSANFTITDDDGIQKITLTVLDSNGKVIGSGEEGAVTIDDAQLQVQENSDKEEGETEDTKTAKNPVTYTIGGSTSANISYILPKTAGSYTIVLSVEDTGYENAGESLQLWHKTESKNALSVSESNFSVYLLNVSYGSKSSAISDNSALIKATADATVTGYINLSALNKISSIECYTMTKGTDSDNNVVWTKTDNDTLIAKYNPSEEETNSGIKTIDASVKNGRIEWSAPIPSSNIKEGEQHFYFVARNANASSSVEFTCKGDGTKPTLKVDSSVMKGNWYKNSSVKFSVLVADFEGKDSSTSATYEASGINSTSVKYSYKIGTTDYTGELTAGNALYDEEGKESATGTYYKYQTTVEGISDTQNIQLNFTAEDNVGNSATSGNYTLQIDTASPTKETLAIKEGQCKKESDSITVSYAFKDSTSGLSKIEFSTDSKFTNPSTVSADSATDFTSGIKEYGTSSSPKTIDISLTGLKDSKEHKIYARVTDVAGNVSDIFETGTFTVDSTAPSVKVTSHKKALTATNPLNRKVTFTGTVSDENLDATKGLTVYYYNSESSESNKWTSLSDKTNDYTCTDGSNWSVSVDLSTLKDGSYPFMFAFTDNAGNSNYTETAPTTDYEYTFTVKQEADRPVITFSDISALSGTVISRSSFKGFVTDDDGDVKGMWYIAHNSYNANKLPSTTNDNGWKKIDVAKSTGEWGITLENEGIQNLDFCVIDSEETVFVTQNDSTTNDLITNRPILKVGSTENKEKTTVSFTYDNTAPVVKLYYAHGTKANETLADDKYTDSGNSVFGPNEYLYVKAEVTEAVGLATENPVILTLGGSTQSVTFTTSSTTSPYTYYATGIALSSDTVSTGSLSISLMAKDKAGLTGQGNQQITIDKDAPTVKIISPTASISDAITGSVTIKGLCQDNASSIQKILYLIPTNDQKELLELKGDITSGWKETGASSSWEIKFASGASESTDSLLYYVNAKDTDGKHMYAIELEGSETENLWRVPIYFKVTDSCGNTKIRTTDTDGNPLCVIVDPDGGKPKAWVNSPEDGSTTSGIVTLYGGASDDVSVSEVRVQIDADGDEDFDNADYSLLSSTTGVWAGTDVQKNLKGSSSSWYILANGTNSWKCSVDTSKIAKSSDKVYLTFRVCAYDADGNTRDWSNSVKVTIDSAVPVIGDLKVVQFGSGVTASSNATPVTEQEYISGMYISNIMEKANGTFYLMGTVTDNECVKYITYEKLTTSSSVNNIDLGLSNVKDNTGTSYTLLIPLKTSESGQINYKIKATDNNSSYAEKTIIINIDSTPSSLYTTGDAESLSPSTSLRLKSLGKKIGKDSTNSTVVNSNGYFTFGDSVSEAGSGLAYVVATFSRAEKRIYNPMKKDAKLALSENLCISSEGFAVQKFTVVRTGGEYVIQSDSFKKTSDTTVQVADFIQVGGLVRIAGTYCLINNFDSSSGIITLSKSVSTSFTKAELIFGQVINHQIIETLNDDGSVTNDDGDKMCETISQIGSTYTWTASFDSTNIPDGPLTIHVVAIDNAGNTTCGSIETKVENNRPRIAKVLLGTDLNSNGKYDWSSSSEIVNTGDENSDTKNGKAFGEFSFYSALDTNTGKIQSTVTLDSNSFKVIDGLCIIPEFVGGNTSLKYILEKPTDLSSATKKEGTELTDLTAKSALLEKISQKGTVKIEDYITSFGGIDLTSLDSGNISLTFWDETEETVQGKTSQWALLKIPVSVMTEEKEKPVPVISPFYWNSKTDNSVYINDAISGHIELEGDLTDSIKKEFDDTTTIKPKVSGKVKIEGTVTDNVRVSSINMSFADLFTDTTLATYTSGEWVNATTLPTGVVSFAAEDVSISQEGHTVKYTLIVDTEKLNNVAGKEKAIKISAKDWKDNASTAASVQTTASAKTALYTVDVVPYVTGIGTELSAFYRSASSVYARTSTGRYPLHESEDITLYGYNLSSSSVSLNGTSLSAGSTAVSLADTDVKGGANTVTITTGTEATSGAFTVTVNSISAINNMNNNKAEYNQQPNGVNNNILTDDIYADVWQFKNAAEPVNGGANYVTMKINPKTGVPGFSYANSILYFNMPGYEADHTNATAWGAENATIGGNQYSQIPFGMNYGGFSYNSFTFDNYGYSYGAAMCTDTQSAKASAFLQFFSRETPIKYNSFDQNMNYVNCANASRLDSSTVQISSGDNGWVTDIDRIQSISMETTHASTSAPDSTNPTYVYMAYYDKSAKQVRFRWGTVGGATDNIDGKANSSSSANFNRVGKSYGLDDVVGSQYTGYAQGAKDNGSLRPSSVSDSFVKYSNTNNDGVPIQVVAATGISGALDYYKTATTYAAGQYVSLAIIGKDTSSPTAVVAWYDSKNMQLCMAYNEKPTTSNTWTSKVIDSNGGINVKIIADSDGGLHFAYYDNKGGSDLKYAYMSSLTSDPQIVTVDSYGSVGAKCTIDLAKNDSGKWVPYIGYQMNAYLGTPLAAKVAYLPEGSSDSVPAGSNASDFYTGKWEISIVPTSNIPNDDLINVGVWRDSNGKAQKFTSNTDWTKEDTKPGTTISNSTLNVGNATILHGNNTSNPIIGYGIDTGAIEMAQKK